MAGGDAFGALRTLLADAGECRILRYGGLITFLTTCIHR